MITFHVKFWEDMDIFKPVTIKRVPGCSAPSSLANLMKLIEVADQIGDICLIRDTDRDPWEMRYSTPFDLIHFYWKTKAAMFEEHGLNICHEKYKAARVLRLTKEFKNEEDKIITLTLASTIGRENISDWLNVFEKPQSLNRLFQDDEFINYYDVYSFQNYKFPRDVSTK